MHGRKKGLPLKVGNLFAFLQHFIEELIGQYLDFQFSSALIADTFIGEKIIICFLSIKKEVP